jgi:hypothetical protein
MCRSAMEEIKMKVFILHMYISKITSLPLAAFTASQSVKA